MGSMTDWISAISSLVGAVVGVLALLAVYHTWTQIFARRQIYLSGLSEKSLGPWKSVVVSSSILPMQTQIKTPTLSVPLLVSKKWQSKISFPVGFELGLKGMELDLEAGRVVLAQTSWVNFLEGLGVSPEDGGVFYKMQYEPELINGIVPMRWEGRDLVAICSILGFQSIGSQPDPGKLMELPTQWSGPLGWLQFRASSEGCIVEYRRRSATKDQLPQEFHDYYKDLDVKDRPFKFKLRLWQSIGGMCLSDEEVIHLSEASEWAEKMRDRGGNAEGLFDEICEELMDCEEELTDEEVRRRFFGRKANRPKGLRPEAFENGMSQLSPQHTRGISNLKFLNSDVRAKEGNSKKMVVLYPSPGHLEISTEGELVHSRGLEKDHLYEYSYIYTDEDEVERVYEHKLGRLRMDTLLLGRMKKAVLQIEPDGFYFSPSKLLSFQVAQIWSHAFSVSERCLNQQYIFPTDKLEFFARKEANKGAPREELYNAINLINSFQRIKSTSCPMFTTADMVLISRASVSLRGLIRCEGMDLVWAILASPELFDHLFNLVTHTAMEDLLDSRLACESGRFNLILTKGSDPEARLAPSGVKGELVRDGTFESIQLVQGGIKVELVKDGTFEGIQVVAALMDVFLNFFWIDRSWVTDVALYDTKVPQSVTMC